MARSSGRGSSGGKHHHERMLFCMSHLIGEEVKVETRGSDLYQGVLHTCAVDSTDSGVVLHFARKLREHGGVCSTADQFIPTVIVESADLVQILAEEVSIEEFVKRSKDMDKRGKGGFQTDKQISGKGGADGPRELKRFDDYAGADAPPTGDLTSGKLSGRGDAWDQFAINKKKFGVTTSFDENEYTTVLDKSTPDFKEKEQAAAKIAAEIEGKSTKNLHMKSERGQLQESGYDEEDLFSSVIPQEPMSETVATENHDSTRDLRMADKSILKAVPGEAGMQRTDTGGATPAAMTAAQARLVDDLASSGDTQKPKASEPAATKPSEPAATKPSEPAATRPSGSPKQKLGNLAAGAQKEAQRTAAAKGGTNRSVPAVAQDAERKSSTTAATDGVVEQAHKGTAGGSAQEMNKAEVAAKETADTTVEVEKVAKEKNATTAAPAAGKKKSKFKFNPNAEEFRPSAPSGGNANPANTFYGVPQGDMRRTMPASGEVFAQQPPMMNANFMGWPGGGRGAMMPVSYVPQHRMGIPMVPPPQVGRYVNPGVPVMPVNLVPVPNQPQQFIHQGMIYATAPPPGSYSPMAGNTPGGHHGSSGESGNRRQARGSTKNATASGSGPEQENVDAVEATPTGDGNGAENLPGTAPIEESMPHGWDGRAGESYAASAVQNGQEKDVSSDTGSRSLGPAEVSRATEKPPGDTASEPSPEEPIKSGTDSTPAALDASFAEAGDGGE
ncbi:hypothetical protein NDN08_004403 [Rhodosorus marinus]|uniref:LsmAD domain-containing protein n=1 Tax=Rhodosorus marinus TaxID=101924 RepID=A0AAV8UMN9_9RHOD|nr:hypothetical protein NDN08_004403 [Rhodosorus marinus]